MNKAPAILGLSKAEEKVLLALTESPQALFQISTSAKTPRTTTEKALGRFMKRGLAKRTKHKGRWLYQKISHEEILRSLFPVGIFPSGAFGIPITESHGITVHRGKAALLAVYQKTFTMPASDRLHIVELSPSAQALLKQTTHEEDIVHSRRASKSGKVFEMVVDEQFFPTIYEYYQKGFDELAKAYTDRPVNVSVIPFGLLHFENDLFIFKSSAYIIDWKNLVAIEIQNKETAQVFMEIFKHLKTLGRQTTLQKLLEEFYQSSG